MGKSVEDQFLVQAAKSTFTGKGGKKCFLLFYFTLAQPDFYLDTMRVTCSLLSRLMKSQDLYIYSCASQA